MTVCNFRIRIAMLGSMLVAVILLPSGCETNRHRISDSAPEHAHDNEEREHVVRPNVGPGSDLPNQLRRAFFGAAASGDIQTAKRMLAREPLLVDARPDNESRTPLIVATWRDKVDMVSFLIARQ